MVMSTKDVYTCCIFSEKYFNADIKIIVLVISKRKRIREIHEVLHPIYLYFYTNGKYQGDRVNIRLILGPCFWLSSRKPQASIFYVEPRLTNT